MAGDDPCERDRGTGAMNLVTVHSSAETNDTVITWIRKIKLGNASWINWSSRSSLFRGGLFRSVTEV